MSELINDYLRRMIALCTKALGLALNIRHVVRTRTFGLSQNRLRRRYGITANTPIFTFGPELEELIHEAALRHGPDASYASTSGSTTQPKRILYTKARLRRVRFAFIDFFARCSLAINLKRTSLYVFSSLNKDESLTSMLLDERGLPSYLSSLQAPYRL